MRNSLSMLCYLLVIALFSLVQCTGPKEPDPEVWRRDVNTSFNTQLDEENSTLVFARAYASIDPSYIACFQLTPQYAAELVESGVVQSDHVEEWLKKYVDYQVNEDNEYGQMAAVGRSPNSYMALIEVKEKIPDSEEEFLHESMVLLVNTDQNVLYWIHNNY